MAASIDPEMSALMLALLEAGGSDLHISANSAAYGRINGELQPLTENRFSSGEIKRLIYSLLSSHQQQQLEKNYELDCAYELKNVSRFRLNIYKEKNNLVACLRSLGNKIPSFKQLGLAQSLLEIIDRPNGLVLVTGPTGSGKSSSLAAILEHINQNKAHHIITVEDPIEFLYQPAKSLIHQRELGEDTHSFVNALRAALREDPDVILVGELRDLETIQLAISAAETGHLVFATLHTNSAAQTIERLIDVFPAAQQSQIRMQLSGSLLAVFAQTLCRAIEKRDGCFGRVMAQEILINNNAIANLIREGKTAQIYSQLQTGGKFGMQTMEQCLANLINNKQIRTSEALTKTARPTELENLLVWAA